MLKDIIITINPTSKQASVSRLILGVVGENMQGDLVVDFNGDFVNGSCWLESQIDGVRGYIPMTKQDNGTYKVPIKSSLLTKAGVYAFQIRVTQEAEANSVPIFKSDIFQFSILDSINAVEETPEIYPNWIDIADGKIAEIDNKINEYDTIKEDCETATANAETATANAETATANANAIADDLTQKLESGHFKGDKGDKGDIDMPEIGEYRIYESDFEPASKYGGTWEKVVDRFLVGAGSKYALSATGGDETHTLTINETPAHEHELVNLYNKNYTGATALNGAYNSGGIQTIANAGRWGSQYVAKKVGGDQPHNNMPPYIAVNIWKRIA